MTPTFGNIYRWDGETLHPIAAHNTPPAFAEAREARDDQLRRPVQVRCWPHVDKQSCEFTLPILAAMKPTNSEFLGPSQPSNRRCADILVVPMLQGGSTDRFVHVVSQ